MENIIGIKWGYIHVNEEEVDSDFKINLVTSEQQKACDWLERSYPELFQVLFLKVNESVLQLNLPASYYLSVNSRQDHDILLRKLLEDNSGVSRWTKKKDFTFWRSSFPPEVYANIGEILGGGNSHIEFCFDDTRGYVINDGTNSYEGTITLDKTGVAWT